MKYKVKNLSKDERKFTDRNGTHIFVEPGKIVITSSPPNESDIWKVQTHIEKMEENKVKKEDKSKMENKMLNLSNGR